MLFALSAQSANVLIYNPVNGFTVDYFTSVNTPSFQGMTNVLINPVLPAGIPIKFTKVVSNSVVPMSFSESNSIIAAESAALDAGVRALANTNMFIFGVDPLTFRAVADTAIDEINFLRLEISIAKTNLTLFQQRATMSPRTLSQFKNSVINKINAGTVD